VIAGLNYWKTGLASSVVTLKKDQRSRVSSFDTIKPKLVEQVKLGFKQSPPQINQKKAHNLFKTSAKKVVPLMTEGSTIVKENYF
jgi:hypothetical protein